MDGKEKKNILAKYLPDERTCRKNNIPDLCKE